MGFLNLSSPHTLLLLVSAFAEQVVFQAHWSSYSRSTYRKRLYLPFVFHLHELARLVIRSLAEGLGVHIVVSPQVDSCVSPRL